MKIGPVSQALIDCMENDSLNAEKFFQLCPKTKTLEKSLYELAHKGYLILDISDHGIEEIAETPKLRRLATEVRKNQHRL